MCSTVPDLRPQGALVGRGGGGGGGWEAGGGGGGGGGGVGGGGGGGGGGGRWGAKLYWVVALFDGGPWACARSALP